MVDAPPSQQAKFLERLETFRDRLLQVDWRNRSILLRQARRKWSLDLAALGPLFAGVAEEAVEKGLAGSGRVALVLDSDDSDTAKDIRASVTQLERSVRLIFEESGLDDCYLGFPFVVGHIAPDKFVRAPIVLFPASLERVRGSRGAGFYLTFSEDEPPVLNRALLAALRKVRGIAVPKGLEDSLAAALEAPEGSPAEADAVLAFLQRLHRTLESASLPLVDQLPASSKPVPLAPITADGLSALPPTRLHLEPLALVGSFPQGSTAIFADYEALLERAAGGETDQGIVDDLLEAPAASPPTQPPEAARQIDLIPDRRLNFALPTDGSQDAVLVEAQQADCVVVRGPPGTGKSQVIVNLITDGLAKGQRVLVVCQKRAALDVVFQRLERAGLADAALLVHDSRADRADQYKRLARRMDGAAPPVDERLARVFEETTVAVDRMVAELNTLVAPLWAEAFGGVRPFELYGAAAPGYTPRLSFKGSAETLTVADLKEAIEACPKLEEGSRRFDGADAPLAGRKPLAAAGLGVKGEFDAALAKVEQAASEDALCLREPGAQAAMISHAMAFNALKAKGYRFLLPSWWRASGAVRRLQQARPLDARVQDPVALEKALAAGAQLSGAVGGLDKWLKEDGWASLSATLEDPKAVKARAGAMRGALSSFEAVVEHDRRVAGLSPAAGALYAACAAGLAGSPEPWAPTLKQEVYRGWISAFEALHPQLVGEPFQRYLELRGRLAQALTARRELLVAQLAGDLARRYRTAKLPPGDFHPNRKADTEWKKLAYEFGKQRRVKSIRRLLEEFPFPFAEVAPCWLTSPEAASDIFPLERGLFDLVIFDEASQLAVERALPAIYRGKRSVIAGDEKQLRPFDLFQIREDEDDEEETDSVTEAESLLVLAMRIFTPRYLSWHYRSKFQELIDFSNHAFYEGNLQIAANVGRSPGLPPIEFVKVAGVWQDRTNPKEAEQVVDIVKVLLASKGAKGEAPSVGVITFNDSQRDLVLDTVEARRGTDPEFDRVWAAADAPDRLLDDRPFVKNLENVQGDERDIIVFSVGYAPGPDGKMRVQFGSLSQEGGENRLNVAVTRAREKVILVASFDPKALPVDDSKNLGPQRLKQYLVYAEAVSKLRKDAVAAVLKDLDPAAGQAPPAYVALTFERPFEDQLKEALEAAGLKVDQRVGFSEYKVDLAVAHPTTPGRYVMAIECDGATFHSARSARERDVERQLFLEAHGWTLERAWSRNWWRSREGEVERLKARASALAEGDSGKTP